MSPIFQQRALRAIVGLNAVLVVLPVAFVAALVVQVAFWWFTARTLDDVGWLGVSDLQVVFWVAVGGIALTMVGAVLARWRLGWRVGDTLRRVAAVGVLFGAIAVTIELAGGVDLFDWITALPLVAVGIVLTYAAWVVPWWFGLRWGQGVLASSEGDPAERRRALGTQGLLLTVWLVSLGGGWLHLPSSIHRAAGDALGDVDLDLALPMPGDGRALHDILDGLAHGLRLKPSVDLQLAPSAAPVHTSATASRLAESPPEPPVELAVGTDALAFNECAERLANARTVPRQDEASRSLVDREISRITRFGVQRADAEDFVMGALLRTCLRDAREPVRDLPSYFVQVVKNELRKFHKRRRLYREIPVEDPERWPGDSVDIERFERAQLIEAVQAVMVTVKAEDRRLLEQHYLEGMPIARIAERLGERAATVRKRLQRARERVRRSLER